MDLKVRGAREHNLRGVSLDLPLHSLVVLCGVSGSGKSSLAFDTLFAEGRRRYLEAAGSSRSRPASLSAPAVDEVSGLPPTVALEQRVSGPSEASSTASLCGALASLRLLFGRAGTQHCPECQQAIEPKTHDQIAAVVLALPPRSRVTVEAPVRRRGASLASVLEGIARAGFSRVRVAGELVRLDSVIVSRLPEDAAVSVVVDRIAVDPERAARVYDALRTASRAGQGEVHLRGDLSLDVVDRPYCPTHDRSFPRLEPRLLDRRSAYARCEVCAGVGRLDHASCAACEGTGLGEVATSVRFAGISVAAVLSDTVSEARHRAAAWPTDAVSERPINDWCQRLDRLIDLGLGGLPLSRAGAELSSGEVQRLRLARQLGGELSGVLYVLDEPAAGLSGAAAQGVLRAVRDLVARGNSVIAVEHSPIVLRGASHIVEFGPGAGDSGGQVLFEGTVEALLSAHTPTGRWLSGRSVLSTAPARVIGDMLVAPTPYGPLSVPQGALVALAGSSGSGKTRRLDALRSVAHIDDGGPFERVIVVDRRSVGRSSRSNVATYTGLWQVMRGLLGQTAEAKIRGLSASQFSLNTGDGRCGACKGSGELVVDLQWLADVYLPCDVCAGRRFVGDVLQVRWKGLAADELLALRAEEARAVLSGHPDLESRLRALVDVGLGYMQLGQSGHTWSGGEAQRLLFARELARAHRRGADSALFVLDDPTVGLHPQDTANLLDLLRRLVDQGATVCLATHDEALAAACDVRIDV